MIVPKHGITFQILQRPHLFQHPATNHGRTSAEPRLQHEKHERGWAVFQLDSVLCVLRCIEIEPLRFVYHIIPFPYCIAEDSILLLALNRGFMLLHAGLLLFFRMEAFDIFWPCPKAAALSSSNGGNCTSHLHFTTGTSGYPRLYLQYIGVQVKVSFQSFRYK